MDSAPFRCHLHNHIHGEGSYNPHHTDRFKTEKDYGQTAATVSFICLKLLSMYIGYLCSGFLSLAVSFLYLLNLLIWSTCFWLRAFVAAFSWLEFICCFCFRVLALSPFCWCSFGLCFYFSFAQFA